MSREPATKVRLAHACLPVPAIGVHLPARTARGAAAA